MVAQTSSQVTQFLTFKLGSEMYALPVVNVREVLDYISVTPIPRSLPFMKGVINLRGGVVPVIDLKKKIDIGEVENSDDTSIIIVELEFDSGITNVGVLVDAVKAVEEIEPGSLEKVPEVGMPVEQSLIDSIGKLDDAFVIILDVNKVFSHEELTTLSKSREEVETSQ